MNFTMSWLISVAFLILVGLVSYPIIRTTLRMYRFLNRLWWRKTSRKRAISAWSQVGQEMALIFESSANQGRLSLKGKLEDISIQIESFQNKEQDNTRITLFSCINPELELFFIEYDSGHHFVDGLSRHDPTYQPKQMKRYDGNFMALGDDHEIIALLNANTRQLIRSSIEPLGLIHVKEGHVIFEREGLYESTEVLNRTITDLKQLAEQFCITKEAIPSRLRQNFADDSNTSIRLRNAKLLFDEYSKTTEASQVRTALTTDDEPEIKLFGAMQLGEAGLDIAKEIANSTSTPEATKINAFKYLAAQIEEEQSLYAVKVMLLLLNSPNLDSIAVIPIAHAIEKFGKSLDETICIHLLEWNKHPQVAYATKIAAAKLLARCGNVASIKPLMQLTKARNKELRQAVDKAILQIQSRLGNVEAGRLSILPDIDHEGALSTTEQIGALSTMQSILRITEEVTANNPPNPPEQK